MGKHFLWDPVEDNIVKEIDDAGTTIVDYTTEPYLYGDLISQYRDGKSSFYHQDAQRSITSLTGSAANITDTYAYSAFGEVTEQTGSTENYFQYIGTIGYYLHRGTCIFIARRREMSSRLARWLSRDPLSPVTDYVSVHNSPQKFVDPSGEAPRLYPIWPGQDTGEPCPKIAEKSVLPILADKTVYKVIKHITRECYIYCYPYPPFNEILWPGEQECTQTITIEASPGHSALCICVHGARIKGKPGKLTWHIVGIYEDLTKTTSVKTECGECVPVFDGPYV